MREHRITIGGFDLGGWQRLRTLIGELRPAAVHCWSATAARYAAAATCCGTRPRLIVAVGEPEVAPLGTRPAFDWLVWRRARALVASGETAARRAIAHGATPSKIEHIAIGPASEAITGPSTAIDKLRSERGWSPSVRLWGIAGPLVAERRLKEPIWCNDQIQCIRGDVHLLVIGDGPQRATLERYVRLCQITKHVHFLGGRPDAAQLIAGLDVYCETALHTGPSAGLLCALAAGVPVVAVDTPGHREAIVPGESGILYPPHFRAGLGREVNRLLNDGQLARRLGDGGRQRTSQAFGLQIGLDRLRRLYGR